MTYSERADRFDRALVEAASASDADEKLAAMLTDPALDHREQILAAATLGEARGPAGSAALRQVFSTATTDMSTSGKGTRAGYRDLICACVVALARRDGPRATDIYVAAANSGNAIVRDYGTSTLAIAGDDRAWEQAMTRLDGILRRKINAQGYRATEVLHTIEYLARYAERGSDRATRLVTLVRGRWRNLPDPGRIEQRYPAIQPHGRRAEDLDLPAAHTPNPWWLGRPPPH